MAEIKIQKKAPVWPWIILIIGFLALLYYLFVYDKQHTEKVEEVETVTTVDDDNNMDDSYVISNSAASKVAEYNDYIVDDEKMGVDHDYSKQSLIKLIDATEAVASSVNMDVKTDLDAARVDAAEITKDAEKLDHANKIKSASTRIVQALTKIQTQKFQDLNGSLKDVDAALAKIDPNVPTLKQKESVIQFFHKAGELLTNMKND